MEYVLAAFVTKRIKRSCRPLREFYLCCLGWSQQNNALIILRRLRCLQALILTKVANDPSDLQCGVIALNLSCHSALTSFPASKGWVLGSGRNRVFHIGLSISLNRSRWSFQILLCVCMCARVQGVTVMGIWSCRTCGTAWRVGWWVGGRGDGVYLEVCLFIEQCAWIS